MHEARGRGLWEMPRHAPSVVDPAALWPPVRHGSRIQSESRLGFCHSPGVIRRAAWFCLSLRLHDIEPTLPARRVVIDYGRASLFFGSLGSSASFNCHGGQIGMLQCGIAPSGRGDYPRLRYEMHQVAGFFGE